MGSADSFVVLYEGVNLNEKNPFWNGRRKYVGLEVESDKAGEYKRKCNKEHQLS